MLIGSRNGEGLFIKMNLDFHLFIPYVHLGSHVSVSIHMFFVEAAGTSCFLRCPHACPLARVYLSAPATSYFRLLDNHFPVKAPPPLSGASVQGGSFPGRVAQK